ncbi:MAG: hypothetical protein F6K23_29470 [Okeania sp. SIO2C9]|uniref:hypothetical protein n=1 Tax=Okeania sp. SIO2C9 TaxID=2607791 RepID=UPI0013BFEFF6|nr:hypothetical protein [Okeania sp. SIO2C9]NEQ76789.1 hypothetical protein [Okeania sp. SIO2C9]
MTTRTTNEKEVIKEALLILKDHLEPLKFFQFVAACNLGAGDYLEFKDKLFQDETHESLYQKILEFRKAKESLTQGDN